ncbi:MarR family transcriptional regulator [Phormidesmis sp. 146-35]
MDSTQRDRDTELALPAENPNVVVSENPFDASSAIEQHILIGLEKIGLALKSQSWQDAGQQGLTPTQGQILALLIDKGNAGMRLSEVAKHLAVTAATASDAVTSLVEKGLVQKTRSPQDKRAIALTLTAQGQQIATQTASWSDFLLNTVDELSEEEQVIFLRGLIKMIRKLQQQGQISVARMCVTCQFFQPNQYPGSDRPHHCSLVNAPFGDRHLRLNCAEQVAADPEIAQQNWNLYLSK